jgi:hypothetical protein
MLISEELQSSVPSSNTIGAELVINDAYSFGLRSLFELIVTTFLSPVLRLAVTVFILTRR